MAASGQRPRRPNGSYPRRFRTAARIAGRLDHRHVVPVYSFGVDDGLLWMAMRLMNGGTLSTRLRSGQPSLRSRLTILQHVAEGLDYGHRLGLLHRDIKPSNVLLDHEGSAYVSDWVGRLSASAESGAPGCSPFYLAPEEIAGLAFDGRADIYSLGVIAYELLTGSVPFQADSLSGVLLEHLNDPVPVPETVPEPVLAPVLQALAKRPEDRWTSAEQFVDRLTDTVASLPAATVEAIEAAWSAP